MTQAPADTARPRSVSRRGLLTGAGALAAFWAAARPALAQPPVESSADVDPGSLLTKLLRRTTYGPTGPELALAASLGYHGYLEYQLNHTAINDSDCESRLANLPTLTQTQQQHYAQSTTLLNNELTEATIIRGIYSKRQLYERMVEFWTDHFSIAMNSEPANVLKSIDDRNVIRVHALGNFGDLLRASAHSPAMLTYLDNQLSTATNINENYGREILELHTMGADNGYTQADVLDVSRCFSGWGYNNTVDSPIRGNFVYTNSRHYQGAKTIFAGTPYQLNIAANGGQSDGDRVLNALIAHPSTAQYISLKMARWLLREDPSPALVNAVAAVYTATNGDIKSMIREILKPNNLASAPPKYKRPYHLMISALRALPLVMTSTGFLRTQLDLCGHRPFFWGTPDGYPDTLLYWQGLILPRWNFGASLLNASQTSAFYINYQSFFSGLTTAGPMVNKIDAELFSGEMDPDDKAKITTYLGTGTVNSTKTKEVLGVAIAAPSFQWY